MTTDADATSTTFTIERVYDALPARVFHAFEDPDAKAAWFGAPDDWTRMERTMDFRVGGLEILSARMPTGLVSRFTSRFHAIAKDRRIVYAYDMHQDDRHISVSLTTVELTPRGKGTRLTFTEHAVFLDGFEDGGGRERRSAWLLDKLGASLGTAP